MRELSRALLIAAALLLLSFSTHFTILTVISFAVNLVLVGRFASGPERAARRERAVQLFAAAIATIAAAALVAAIARSWLEQMLIFPIDAQRADMLVVIQEGLRRVLRGQNPYTMYRVPWEVTLPYGPMLWLPYMVPHLLRADIRVVSFAGALFVPVACAVAAFATSASGRYTSTAGLLVILAGIAASDDLRNFMSIAHTPAYWPLLALFAWCVVRERWYAAALLCGLLIVARTTMVALAPVLAIAVWHRDRSRAVRTIAILAVSTIAPYLPFAVWDFAALKYALYGSYQHLMKEFVWTQTTWAHQTIGVTGMLLRTHRQASAESAQIALMAIVYAASWRSLRRGGLPLPWMAFALFAFSATTLWPVHYIYLDVTVLWVAAVLADTEWFTARSIASAWTNAAAATALVAALIVIAQVRRQPSIDVGIGASRPLLYHGFSTNEGTERTFSWIDGTSADVLVARRSRADATIEIVCQPHLPLAESTQQMSAALNGIVLGVVPLRAGWQTVAFAAPGQAWRYGVNELTLSLSTAASPAETHTGDDSRKLSAAIDRLTVRTRP